MSSGGRRRHPAAPPGRRELAAYHQPVTRAEIEPIQKSLISAGSLDIAVSVQPRVKDVADPVAFAQGLVLGSPLFEQIRERGGVSAESLVDALTERLTQEHGDSPMRLPMQAILYEARAA